MQSDAQEGEPLTVGVPREVLAGERRVAAIPDTVAKLVESGLRVLVETRAGAEASFLDGAYREVGATIAPDAATVYGEARLVLKVRSPTASEIELLQPGSVLVAFLGPLRNAQVVEALAARGVTGISMDAIPRITRAQAMDALSSMSTIAGYKAVLLGAESLGRLFPMLMTAAGTLAPARVLVLGAGVAGLQALATARRLGAVTEAFDTRPVVREQVQSVGATFIEMPLPEEEAEGEGGYAREMSQDFYRHEREAIRDNVARADVVITTALVPGKPAPLLITEEMVESMRPGSVIVDLAAETGGNCALTVPNETIRQHEVTILGPINLPSTVPVHASQMYARNVANLVGVLIADGKLHLDFEDEIVRAAAVARPQEARI